MFISKRKLTEKAIDTLMETLLKFDKQGIVEEKEEYLRGMADMAVKLGIITQEDREEFID